MSELKIVVGEYISVISQLGDGTLKSAIGDRRRRELHNEILDLTGLSAFEFGGLPAWYKIENIEHATTRLCAALREQMKA